MRDAHTPPPFRVLLPFVLSLAAACSSEPTKQARGGAHPAKAALTPKAAAPPEPPLSAEERLAREQAAASVEHQTAEQQAQHRRAALLAHRTALATQREVLEQMREARARATPSDRVDIDARMDRLQNRIAERSTHLRQLESTAP